MNLITSYYKHPVLAKAIMFLQIKSRLDKVLPDYLALHYSISQDSNNCPVILINNSVWLLQLKQHEAVIKSILQGFFDDCSVLQWKVKPGF